VVTIRMDLGFALNEVKKEEKSKPAPFEKQNPKGAAPPLHFRDHSSSHPPVEQGAKTKTQIVQHGVSSNPLQYLDDAGRLLRRDRVRKSPLP